MSGDKNKINKQTCLRILDWCFWNIGLAVLKPQLRVNNKLRSDKDDTIMYAEYRWPTKTIHVNIKAHEEVDELVDTIIHEYVHHSQDGARYLELLELYQNGGTKHQHPMEIEAKSIAKKFKNECLNYILYGE